MEEQPLQPESPIEDGAPEEKKPRLPAWTKYVFIALAAAVVLLYLHASGWGAYVHAYVTCGAAQPIMASSTNNGHIYYMPDNRRYSAPGEGAFFKAYYCTESDARAGGFLRAGP